MASLTMGELGNSLTRSYNEYILNDLSVGDLIEFKRGGYSHWAVYFGNKQVIHMTGDDNDRDNADVLSGFSICGARFKKAKVCIEDFWKVAAGSLARKNNTKDETWRPLSPAQIVRNARQRLGQVEYNVFFSNCEHFAKWCRYGIEKSDQAEQAITGAATVIGIGLGAVLAVKAISAFASLFNNEEEEEEN